ncbi:Unknown protein, partial [Striga hermonthica]
NKKSFKVVCKSDEDQPCPWKARVTHCTRVHELWEVTKWTERNSCMQELDKNDHRNVTATMISNLVMTKIQKKPDYSVTLIQEDVKKCWKVDVSYKKAWQGRKKAIDRLYGTWEENFAQLP